MKRFLFPLLGILLLIGLVAGAGYLGFKSNQTAATSVQAPPTIAVARGDVVEQITAPGQLIGARERTLSAGINGRLAKINVHPGDRVKAGDVLAELDQTGFRFALQTAQANLAGARARLNELNAPASEADLAAARAQVTSAQSAYDAAASRNAHNADQITVARTALDKAKVALDQAQSAYDRVSWRSDIGMLPQSAALQQATIDYHSAEANYNLAIATVNDSALKAAAQSLAQAQANLAKLTAPPSRDEVAAAQSTVDAAQVAVDQAQSNLDQTRITAPFDGVIQSVQVQEGDTVNDGTALIQLSDPQAIEVRSTVTEEDYPLARVGQTVQAYLDAQPDVTLTGKITYLVPLREASSTSPVYPVYIALDQIPAGIAPGMTVDASILIAQRTNVLRLPRSLVHARSDGTAQVRVWANDQTENRTIKTGLRGDQYVEILDGLREGELVISR